MALADSAVFSSKGPIWNSLPWRLLLIDASVRILHCVSVGAIECDPSDRSLMLNPAQAQDEPGLASPDGPVVLASKSMAKLSSWPSGSARWK